MKKTGGLLVALTLCAALAACGGEQAGQSEYAPPPAVSSTPEASRPEAPDRSDGKWDRMYSAYSAALENLLNHHVLPDGTDCGAAEGDDLPQNQFAIYDVDRDGEEELLVLYTNTFSAGMVGCVLAYDEETGGLRTELSEFPQLTFYDNGVVRAEWSHNQGLAGDFWPYTLYHYAAGTDSYELVAMVDAWDRNVRETDDQGNPFPEAADRSGTGIVYYIMTGGQYDVGRPADAAEYTDWINGYVGSAPELEIPYQDLTEKTVRQMETGL